MYKDNYEIFERLRSYYEKNCAKLVFYGEKRLDNNKSCKMYFLDTTNDQELMNYKKLFQEYLFLYVRNYDMLHMFDNIKAAEDEESLSKALYKNSKQIWNDNSLIKISKPMTLGIYGELYDEFYLNIVKKENILITYASKGAFNERNIKGCDTIGAKWENNNLTLIISECKFYSDISSASKSLIGDILGTDKEESHITKDYINRYVSFIANKPHSIFSTNEENKKIIMMYEKINHELLNKDEGITAIDILNKYKLKIRFDFFAIYKDNVYTPNEREDYYNRVITSFNKQIKSVGMNNYSMEIIFIPTKNESTALKRGMYTWN